MRVMARRLRVARRLIPVATATLMLVMVLAPAASAEGLRISVGAAPMADQKDSVTVSGRTEEAGKLTVYLVPGSQCPSLLVDEADGEPVGEEDVPAAPAGASVLGRGTELESEERFSQTYIVTPSNAGDFVLCAYLEEEDAYRATPTAEQAFDVMPAPHLTALRVRMGSHAGNTAAKPGRSELFVWTTAATRLSVVVKHKGHTLRGEVKAPSTTFVVPWHCSAPGGIWSRLVIRGI